LFAAVLADERFEKAFFLSGQIAKRRTNLPGIEALKTHACLDG
jgi:hypothetical protein